MSMKLTDALLQEVITSLKRDDPNNPGAALRREPRHHLVGRATIIPCPEHTGRKPISVGVRDLSASGIGIVHAPRLMKNERFILRLPPVLGGGAKGILCNVARVESMPNGTYEIGGIFAGVIQLADAGKPPQPDPAGAVPPVEQLLTAFRKEAESLLSDDERQLLHQIEQRLLERCEKATSTPALA